MRIIAILLSVLLIGCSSAVITQEPTPDTLTEGEIRVLNDALISEYKALAVYKQASDDLDQAEPFPMSISSEEANIMKLIDVFENYGLEVPENTYTSNSFETLRSACETSIEIEKDKNYRKFVFAVDNPDVVEVFKELQKTTENHLAEFKKCSLGLN